MTEKIKIIGKLALAGKVCVCVHAHVYSALPSWDWISFIGIFELWHSFQQGFLKTWFLLQRTTHIGVCYMFVSWRALIDYLWSSHLLSEKAMAPHSSTLAWKIHGRRSLVGCSPWGHEESDTTERLHFHFLLSCIGEGNGNPLQYSCLENPRDGGAWWAAVYWVAQSRTWLKRLSSSSSILELTLNSALCELCQDVKAAKPVQ